MSTINFVEPTIKSAQKLNDFYSTIESKKILYEKLNTFFDVNYIESFSGCNVHEIYNHIILNYYPNELSVKANFINRVLINGKTHVSIFELPIVNSRADLCKINGESIVYEIKTDLDNFNRLSKQINDYQKIFDKVFVICSKNKKFNIIKHIPKEIGVYTYRITKKGRYIFKLERNALNANKLDSKEQLLVLQKKELSKIVNNSAITSKEDMINYLINTKNSIEINSLFKNQLKNRYKNKWDFFKQNYEQMLEIDYQWFYKNTLSPKIIYR